ncbi:hypothetical protein EM595_1945 [Duffyella gerundensis]|uniref:Uncharacterized protein n=1 Tax=Duffyella gerundensis TaxID=1619313 RepID=A0A0U5L680_9GAMM|nr:hypothetical protein EM595_1945 [Duffyella gerundensis]
MLQRHHQQRALFLSWLPELFGGEMCQCNHLPCSSR